MLRITNEELELLLRLYKKVSLDILNKTGIEVEGGHVEIYDIYLKDEDDVGIALYYDSKIHEDNEPLSEYITYTDSPIDIQRFSFFKKSGEPLKYRFEEMPIEQQYAIHVFLDKPIKKGDRLDICAKAHMGGKIWMNAPHHKRLLKRGEPTFFDGMRGILKLKYFHATLWKMPKGCKLFEVFPQPWEIYVEDNRLNILFIFYTPGFCKMYIKYLNP